MLRFLVRVAAVVSMLVFYAATPLFADEVFQVNGSFTVPGNSDFPGVSETVQFSFQLQFLPAGLPGLSMASIVPGSGTASGTGPFGAITVSGVQSADDLVEMADGNGEFDIYFTGLIATGTPNPTSRNEASLYSCFTLTLCTEFYPGGAALGAQQFNDNGPLFGVFENGTGSYTVSGVPEPAVLVYIVVAGVLLLGFHFFRLRFGQVPARVPARANRIKNR